MLLNDSLQHFRRARVIPRAFRINDGDGAALADAEAIGFGAKNQRLGTGQAEFLQAAFQKTPRGQAVFLGAALGFGLVGAQKNVPLIF